jgi:hypothetical protein
MRRPRLLIGLFLLATVLVDVAAFKVLVKLVSDEETEAVAAAAYRERAEPVLLALYFSQVSLVAIWMGLGRTPAAMRIAVGLPLLIALGDPETLSSVVPYRPLIDFTAQVATAVAVPLLVARLLGVRLTNINVTPPPPPARGRQRFQFSIRFQFGLMTALAVILGTLQWTGSYALIPATYRIDIHCTIVPLALGHAVMAWAVIWAALGVRATGLRMMVLVCATLAASVFTPTTLYVLGWPVAYAEPLVPPNGIFIFLEAALLAVSLWLFRRAGYRVVFRCLVAEAAPSEQ